MLYCKIKTIKAFGSQKVIFGNFWQGIGHNPVNIHTLGERLFGFISLPIFAEKSNPQLKIKLIF